MVLIEVEEEVLKRPLDDYKKKYPLGCIELPRDIDDFMWPV